MNDLHVPNHPARTRHDIGTALSIILGNAGMLRRQLARSPSLDPDERQAMTNRLVAIDRSVMTIVELLERYDPADVDDRSSQGSSPGT